MTTARRPHPYSIGIGPGPFAFPYPSALVSTPGPITSVDSGLARTRVDDRQDYLPEAARKPVALPSSVAKGNSALLSTIRWG